MFLLVLPIALVALAIGAKLLENFGERGNQRLDVLSVLLSIPAFGGIVYGLSRFAVSSGTGIGLAVAVLATGLVCLALFGWRQIELQRSGDPLLDLRAFKIKMFSLSVAMLCIAMMALFGALILLPIYLQSVRGLSSLETGFLLLPGGLLMGLLAPTVGRIFDKYGPRVLVPPGAVLIVLNLLGLTQVDQHTPVWMLVGLHVILSLGFACLFTPAFTTGLNPLPPSLYSHGSAIMATLQQVAGAAGTALLVTIMAGRTISLVSAGTSKLAAQVSGLHAAFAVATGVAVLAVALSLFLRNPPRPVGEIDGAPAAQ
jgi:DHA2 family lincomycin resistance protein-like MFS transporter